MSTVIGYNYGNRANVQKTISAAYTVPEGENGMTYDLNAAAGAAITLPAPKKGLEYSFVIGAAFATTSWTVVTNGGANIISGSIVVAGAVVVASAEDTITFVNSAETIGDQVHLVSDGTNWFVSGDGAVTGSITATAS